VEKTKLEGVKKELDDLAKFGRQLYYRLAIEEGKIKEEDLENFEEKCGQVKSFNAKYELFYTQAFSAVKTLAPHRLDDFVKQYRDEKRKIVSVATYLISDAIVGYQSASGLYNRSSAIPRMKTQAEIISAISGSLENVIFDIEGMLRADLFDSNLEEAKHLLKAGYVRPAGVLAGVVLEKHLAQVAERLGFSSRKAHPSIADFNESLKVVRLI
jgi:major membrane immunogen (membrane-anchored lipoprotein)